MFYLSDWPSVLSSNKRSISCVDTWSILLCFLFWVAEYHHELLKRLSSIFDKYNRQKLRLNPPFFKMGTLTKQFLTRDFTFCPDKKCIIYVCDCQLLKLYRQLSKNAYIKKQFNFFKVWRLSTKTLTKRDFLTSKSTLWKILVSNCLSKFSNYLCSVLCYLIFHSTANSKKYSFIIYSHSQIRLEVKKPSQTHLKRHKLWLTGWYRQQKYWHCVA